MSYSLFLLYTAVFLTLGLLVGIVLVLVGSRHRVALRALLMSFRARPERTLLHPVPLPQDRQPAQPSGHQAG